MKSLTISEEGGRTKASHISFFADTEPGQGGDMVNSDLLCWWSGASEKGDILLALSSFSKQKKFLISQTILKISHLIFCMHFHMFYKTAREVQLHKAGGVTP